MSIVIIPKKTKIMDEKLKILLCEDDEKTILFYGSSK